MHDRRPARHDVEVGPSCRQGQLVRRRVGPASASAVATSHRPAVSSGRRAPCATPAAATLPPANRGSTPTRRPPKPTNRVTRRARRSAVPPPTSAARPRHPASLQGLGRLCEGLDVVSADDTTSFRKISARPIGECAMSSSVDATYAMAAATGSGPAITEPQTVAAVRPRRRPTRRLCPPSADEHPVTPASTTRIVAVRRIAHPPARPT